MKQSCFLSNFKHNWVASKRVIWSTDQPTSVLLHVKIKNKKNEYKMHPYAAIWLGPDEISLLKFNAHETVRSQWRHDFVFSSIRNNLKFYEKQQLNERHNYFQTLIKKNHHQFSFSRCKSGIKNSSGLQQKYKPTKTRRQEHES